ncbi:hypothetical protein C5167_046753 [Papaver somniferum]|uniref:ACT domain-containing protein ACR n=1 Tax=Papaver somniferum TaxID=3469 RepID=A0A4Y7LIM5_PAPSO|nr:hypothetical protein C5167_046753 [Papaver somniferum]
MKSMGFSSDDVVLIEKGNKPGEPYVITVNCPDKTGLGCDLCRIILDFGLSISKGDVSTDGKWCYVVLWVIPHSFSSNIRWASLKDQLVSVCPSNSASFYFNQQSDSKSASSPQVYLLKFCGLDRKGLLHDVTKVFCELELTIQRVKVMTTPDDKVMDMFFVTDNLELLHTKKRRDDTCRSLYAILGDSCISCDLQLSGPEYEALQHGVSSPPPTVAEELFCCELSEKENLSHALTPDLNKLKSPSIAYGRFSSITKGFRDVDLFIQQKDGKKLLDSEKQSSLCFRLKVEMLHPLRVTISNRGPDTELLVANPVEICGKGRPRVFYDVTLALKVLGICIFSAEIGRNLTSIVNGKSTGKPVILNFEKPTSIFKQSSTVEVPPMHGFQSMS